MQSLTLFNLTFHKITILPNIPSSSQKNMQMYEVPNSRLIIIVKNWLSFQIDTRRLMYLIDNFKALVNCLFLLLVFFNSSTHNIIRYL